MYDEGNWVRAVNLHCERPYERPAVTITSRCDSFPAENSMCLLFVYDKGQVKLCTIRLTLGCEAVEIVSYGMNEESRIERKRVEVKRQIAYLFLS